MYLLLYIAVVHIQWKWISYCTRQVQWISGVLCDAFVKQAVSRYMFLDSEL